MKTGVTVLIFGCIVLSYQNPLEQKRVEILPQSYAKALEAVFGVGIRLTAFLEDDIGENFLVSPLSATVVIAQLMLGTTGEFRDQLYELLQLPKTDTHKIVNKDKNCSISLPYSEFHLQMRSLLKALEGTNTSRLFTLKENSALFYNDKIDLNTEFEKNLKDYYGSLVYPLNFTTDPQKSYEIMNAWASNNTNGLIQEVINQPPSPKTVAILANAIYFLAEWETPFSEILNEVDYFNVTETKRVNVTYMRGVSEQIFYAESKDYRIINLPYKKEELGMYIILPNEDNPNKYNIKAFIKDLKSNEVLETIDQAKRHDVIIKLPKMSLSSTVRISKQLKKYQQYKKQEEKSKITFDEHTNELDYKNRSKSNITKAIDRIESKVLEFTNFTADETELNEIYLEAASSVQRFKLNDIVQQVVFSVNEKGTEAAAVTSSSIYYMLTQQRFILNRPFVFFIRHQATSATLFWGSISNPSVND